MDNSTDQGPDTRQTTEEAPYLSLRTLVFIIMAMMIFSGVALGIYRVIAFNNDGVAEKTCQAHAEQYVKTDNNVVQGRIFACVDSNGKITQRFVATHH